MRKRRGQEEEERNRGEEERNIVKERGIVINSGRIVETYVAQIMRRLKWLEKTTDETVGTKFFNTYIKLCIIILFSIIFKEVRFFFQTNDMKLICF